MDEISITTEIDVPPSEVFKAWLDSKAHSLMTGANAVIDGRIGGQFTAHDGYISGEFLEIEADRRILQKWRTTDFPDDAPDSLLEIQLFAIDDDGCLVKLIQTNIPEGQGADYLEGWEDHYFEPMRDYFGEFVEDD